MPIKDPWNRSPMRGDGWTYLDEELCFDLWNELGDVGRAAKELERRGVANPDTGKPPSRPGVYIAALRYVSKNIEDARQKIVNAGGDWANNKLAFLTWVVDRMQQSNQLGNRARREWNESILGFADGYLAPDEYRHFMSYVLEAVPGLEVAPAD